ncbi:hypothetical protein PR202_ga22570 [Eleusine coracana subsp. coracana]|uniref:Major facilitator superfamily (MFS) profile domain-containing protein n=1 Tax=Eleusine coracana subsp. coracana TaxID=191504 RepID=A0AAV5D402_ELECO|nr:hypothetical protein PR202_ga22570 [Eleusine coracana subsp. coracana]
MAHEGVATPLLAASASTESGKPRRNLYPFAFAMLASMSTVLMGYNLAVMSGAEIFIREDLSLSDAEVEVLAGSMNVYMLVSILAAGQAADLLGRRGALVLANAFFLAGALGMSVGRSYAALMAARFVTGVGVGFSLVVAPVYNAEISPASTRGLLSSLLDICINVGILLGYLSNYLFASMPLRSGWRVMYAVGALPPPLLAAGVILAMPESPRWLAMRGRHTDALAVLIRTSDATEEADLRLEEIIKHAAGGGAWTELLVRPSATTRRVLVCVIGLQFFQEASGIEAVVLYTPLVFKQAGMSSTNTALLATVAVGVVKTLSIVAAALLADRLGRRPLLLASAGGVTAAMLSLAAALRFKVVSACVAAVMAFVVAFSVGFGPLVPAYGAEAVPLRLRAQGSSLGTAVGRVTCGLVSMTFISLADWITMPGCFVVYAGVAAAACVFVYVRVPETRGRGLEDMEVLFAK